MNSINNDPLIAELRELTTGKDVCASKLRFVCDKVKNKVSDGINQNKDFPDSLRYAMHMRNELIRGKDEEAKKKQCLSLWIG